MWRIFKWTLGLTSALIVFMFLHYVLPQHDIVRISGTEVIRTDFTAFNRIFFAQADAGNAEGTTRDVRLINSVRTNGKVMVYRNEDTGWIWPPYFKFDSSNLQAEAIDLVSTKEAPQWVSVTHYGWRIPFLSVYPNAVSVKTVAGPDVRIIPWVNIIILLFLAWILFMLYRMIAQFRERSIDPMLEEIDEAADTARARARGVTGRIGAWLGTWRRKDKLR